MTAASLAARSLFLLLTATACTVEAQSNPDARNRILAAYAALQSAESDYSRLVSRGKLSPGEAADYRIYIAGLRDRLYAGCSQLPQVDRDSLTAAGPCPAQASARPRAAAIDLKTERTRGERAVDLDQELSAALSEFDEMLLREQEQVKAARPVTAAAMAGADGGADGGEAADGDGRRAGDDQGRGTNGKARGAAATSADGETAGTGERGTAGPVASSTGDGGDVPRSGRMGSQNEQQAAVRGRPPDVPDGRDDDVVARQLREAAEKETDPELQAKLWEEYRKYKRGTQ